MCRTCVCGRGRAGKRLRRLSFFSGRESCSCSCTLGGGTQALGEFAAPLESVRLSVLPLASFLALLLLPPCPPRSSTRDDDGGAAAAGAAAAAAPRPPPPPSSSPSLLFSARSLDDFPFPSRDVHMLTGR